MTEYLIIFFLLILSIITNKKTILFPTLLYMLVIGCFRGESVGTDIATYYNNFVYSRYDPKSWDAGTYFETGFTYILLFIKYNISKNYLNYISILFFYTFCITIWFFLKYSKYKSISIFVLYTLGGYFFYMNGMRQSFAFATSLIALDFYFKTNKIVWYESFIILISILLHNSCIILCAIPILPILANKIRLKKRQIYIAIFISLIFATVLQSTLLNIIGIFLPLLGRFSTYITNAETQGLFMMMFMNIACLSTIYFTKDIKNIFFLSYVFGIICYNLLASFSPTAPRMAFHLTFLAGICFSFTYYDLKRSAKIIYLTIIIILGSIHFSYAYLIKGYEGVTPYIFRNVSLSKNNISPLLIKHNEPYIFEIKS